MDGMNASAPPGCIWTTRGWLHEGLLTKTVGKIENENEATTWQEWHAEDGEMVKREAQIQLKKWPEGFDPAIMQAMAGNVGG